MADVTRNSGGTLQAVVRHERGTVLIDGLWCSPTLRVSGLPAELQADGGDHSIAEVVFDTVCPFRAAEWRHSKTPRDTPEGEPINLVFWLDVASSAECWCQALGSVNTAWAR